MRHFLLPLLLAFTLIQPVLAQSDDLPTNFNEEAWADYQKNPPKAPASVPIEQTNFYKIPVSMFVDLQIMDEQNRYVSSPVVKLYDVPGCHWGEPKQNISEEDNRIVSLKYATTFTLDQLNTLTSLCLDKLAFSISSKDDWEFPDEASGGGGLVRLQPLDNTTLWSMADAIRKSTKRAYDYWNGLPLGVPERSQNGESVGMQIFIRGVGTADYKAHTFKLNTGTPKLEVNSIFADAAKQYGWTTASTPTPMTVRYDGGVYRIYGTERDYEMDTVPKPESRPLPDGEKPAWKAGAEAQATPNEAMTADTVKSSPEGSGKALWLVCVVALSVVGVGVYGWKRGLLHSNKRK